MELTLEQKQKIADALLLLIEADVVDWGDEAGEYKDGVKIGEAKTAHLTFRIFKRDLAVCAFGDNDSVEIPLETLGKSYFAQKYGALFPAANNTK